jgi:hypothetical protein
MTARYSSSQFIDPPEIIESPQQFRLRHSRIAQLRKEARNSSPKPLRRLKQAMAVAELHRMGLEVA